jgi:hypothetical protein
MLPNLGAVVVRFNLPFTRGILHMFTSRRSFFVVVCLGVLLVLIGFYKSYSRRDRALTVAKQLGHVEIDNVPPNFKRLLVSLGSRKAVNNVLPLLKDVPDLTSLVILNVNLTEQDLTSIGQLTQLPDLTLGTCDINDEDLRFLTGLSNLHELQLNGNPITDNGLRHLSALVNLEKLELTYTRVQGTGLDHITAALRSLTLRHTLVNDDTIIHCTHFRRLHTLYFLHTDVTGDGLMRLVGMHWLLTIGPPKSIPEDVVRRFRAAQKAATAAARSAGEDVPPGPPATTELKVI